MNALTGHLVQLLRMLWKELCQNGWRMDLCVLPDDPTMEYDPAIEPDRRRGRDSAPRSG